MLCFDPTRGIDIRTKQQIYVLLRDLAEAGAAVLLYTSELKEIQLACDRAIVIFGGEVVAEIDAADADEPALLRAAHNLAAGRAAARGGRGRGRRGARRREAARPSATGAIAGDRPMTAADARHGAAPSGRRAGLRAQRVDARPARLPRSAARLHEAHPARLRRRRRPGPAISSCPWRLPRSPRRSS